MTDCNNLLDLEKEILDQFPKIPISQKHFKEGPFHITKSGYYYLTECIEFSFYDSTDDFLNTESTLGHFAGIIIECDYVVIDLCGFTIKQSIKDYALQRFFALIQLNSFPFIPNVGPIPNNPGSDFFKIARNCVIKNGILGRSSHQAILGNGNSNIVCQDLIITHFEVSGITLNNVTNCLIDRIKIINSLGYEKNHPVPFTPLFTGFLSILKLLKQLEQTSSVINFSKYLHNLLYYVIDVIDSSNCFSSLLEFHNKLKNICIDSKILDSLVNMSPHSLCNIHGIKITVAGPSIGHFIDNVNSEIISENILLSNITISNLIAQVDESLLIGKSSDNKPIAISAGLVINSDLIEIKDECLEILTSLINIRDEVDSESKLIKCGLTLTEFNELFYSSNNKSKYCIIKNHDIMGHLNKGVMGIRIGGTENICMEDIVIRNIHNVGTLQNQNMLDFLKSEFNITNVVTQNSFLMNKHLLVGTFATGIIYSSCKCIEGTNIVVKNILSKRGSSLGFVVNNKTKTMNMKEISINNLMSAPNMSDSGVILVEENSNNIKVQFSYYN